MKRFMPFWWFDAVRTEDKLNALAKKGTILRGMGDLGVFEFESGAPAEYVHRCVFLPGCRGKVPAGLQEKGWETVCARTNCYIVRNRDTHAGISYEREKKANNISIAVLFFLMCGVFGYLSGYLGAAADHSSETDFSELAGAIVVFTLMCLLMIALVTVHSHLSKKGDALKLGGAIKTIPEENFIYTKEQEKQMKREGTLKTSFRPGWFYSPDKAGEYVENMAQKGWKFYRLDEAGVVFYFVKSEPCHIAFVTDYQNHADDGYFTMAKDDGWKLEFTSVSRVMGFSMWTKTYADGEEEPEFYSDTETAYQQSKKLLIAFGIPFGMIMVCIALFGSIIISNMLAEEETGGFLAAITGIYSVLFVEFAVFFVKIAGYFLRMRKRRNL